MSTPFSSIEFAQLTWRNGVPYCTDSSTFYLDRVQAERFFIKGNDLINRWKHLKSDSFVIAQTKFGSGLNFLISWVRWLQYAPGSARLHFISGDNRPIALKDMERLLSCWPEFRRESSLLLSEYPVLTPGFHHFEFDQGRINLTLMLGEVSHCFSQLLICGDPILEKSLRSNFIDACFLNAVNYTPESLEDLLKSIGMLSRSGTTLTSDSDLNKIQSNLEAVGFKVAHQHALFVQSGPRHKIRKTPWHLHSPRKITSKKAIVVGAGLAGCFTAHSLAKRGWHVSLIDMGTDVAIGASGNPQAILYPKLSAFCSPLTLLMLNAYLYAHRFYSSLLATFPIGELSGIIQLGFSQKEVNSQESMRQWLLSNPALGRLVNAEEASSLAGLVLDKGGLFLPLSGWMNCKALCSIIIKSPSIQRVSEKFIETLLFDNGQWSVDGENWSEILILANGDKVNQFVQTAHLPVKSMFGQLTFIANNQTTRLLKIPLCGEGHVLPSYHNQHLLGATYHQVSSPFGDYATDDKENLAKLITLGAGPIWTKDIMSHWSGIRAATPDYLPLVGPAPNALAFLERFKSLSTDSKRWLPLAGEYYPGLYLCAGFGSRGLTTIPLCAEWLASYINNEPPILPHSLVQALSPARFLIKEIVKN